MDISRHKENYGKKKEFICQHWDDICHLRKRMSAEKVSKIYGCEISKYVIYRYEREFK